MWRVVPKGWLSRDLTILENGRSVALVGFARFSGAAHFAVGDAAYTIREARPVYGSWVLERDGEAIAYARSVRALFRHSCVIEYGGKRYQVQERSAFRRDLVVREGVQFVGYIEPERAFARTLRACLPEDLPLAVRVFIVALAANPWTDQDEIM